MGVCVGAYYGKGGGGVFFLAVYYEGDVCGHGGGGCGSRLEVRLVVQV